MRLLLDAHSLIWAVDDPSKLGPKVVAIIENPANELLVSAGTIWELAIKVGLGKLKLSLPFGQWMNQAITDLGCFDPAHLDSARGGAGTVARNR